MNVLTKTAKLTREQVKGIVASAVKDQELLIIHMQAEYQVAREKAHYAFLSEMNELYTRAVADKAIKPGESLYDLER
jgi:hypothetical protein